MASADEFQIHDLATHPDAEALREHDHPRNPLRDWKAVLTAKAWIGTQLACFFVEQDGRGRRIVLFFNEGNEYRPRFGGGDMRDAPIAALYGLDVAVPKKHLPVVERAERIRAFPARSQ